MKNAVVVGATSQVGFALCQELMNHEVEVIGFEWSEKMDERAHEMLMGIGRNAFFHLQLDQPLEKDADIAFYFIDRMERLDQTNQATYFSIAEKAKKLVLISSYKNYRKNIDFSNKIKKKRKEGTNCLAIYLPMIVGPWQGEEEAVHRRLQEEMDEKEHQPIALQDTDVLYVEDVVKAIYELSNTDDHEKVVRFKNKNPKALKELMDLLHLTLLADVSPDGEWDKVTDYMVQQSLTMKESLQAQRKQMRQKLKLD
ncbi:hypothetical protein [Sutcliffiella horikoshii]|uniref:hypothetical protein n=1 Tax=Sutcliffiella horikoshii TaxID=79883 RepID=UPI001F433F04|nr:hypothetical protein [Sutcliffiella horikoshii]MCG1020094.1 hypothetical protein [Sutcliffiella horikoshii]